MIHVRFGLHTEPAAALLYIKKQWGIETTQDAVEVALRHLAVQTRLGLKRIQLDIIDAMDEQ